MSLLLMNLDLSHIKANHFLFVCMVPVVIYCGGTAKKYLIFLMKKVCDLKAQGIYARFEKIHYSLFIRHKPGAVMSDIQAMFHKASSQQT